LTSGVFISLYDATLITSVMLEMKAVPDIDIFLTGSSATKSVIIWVALTKDFPKL
jgi:hypothetical protein